jgi:hypothetical protein
MLRESHSTRHIVLDTITEDGSLILGCSDCYWRSEPIKPDHQLITYTEAIQPFDLHSCAAYRQKKAAA